jgi:two-component system invasion response regulator UvrY
MRPTLSRRQREVLYWLGEGKTVSEIALILGISVKTASTYRCQLLDKLLLVNTAQLIRYAIVEGIDSPA